MTKTRKNGFNLVMT